jgi:lysophospholipase L1-like esterase
MANMWEPEIGTLGLETLPMSLFRILSRATTRAVFTAAAMACALGTASAADATIAAWGDSLTLSFGAQPGEDYPAVAAKILGRPVENHGIGGQTSTQIAARMGALAVLATVDGGTIRAAGPVPLTLSIDVVLDTAYGRATVDGVVCGARGTISAQPSRWTFTRSSAGEAVPCPAGSPFLPDVSVATHDGTVWLCLGRNGADTGHTIEADIAAAVASLGHDRYIVAPVLTAGTDGDATLAAIAAINANLQSTYGDRFVDVLAELLAAGDGSPADNADIAKGIVPRSLRWDFVHLTARGNEIVARAFAAATRRLGF